MHDDGTEIYCDGMGPEDGSSQSKIAFTEAAQGDCIQSGQGTVGTIYILETEDRSFIKIGYTGRMSMRLAQHAAFVRKTGGDVRLIGFFPGTRRTEARLHAYFIDCRYRTEWYHREPAMAKLALLFDQPLPVPVEVRRSEAAVALGRVGGSAKVRKGLSMLTREDRKRIAKQGAEARWGKGKWR